MIPNLTGSLSSIINIVPGLDKLTIIPLKKASPVPLPSWTPYIVQFNPENFSETMKIMYDQVQAIGSTGAKQAYKNMEPRGFTIELLIDGTGASGDKREVIAEIELFKAAIGFRGELHRPSFLLLVWGVHVITAVLKHLDIKYTMFRKNGTPLRATIQATFSEHKDPILQLLEQDLQSSDLTSRHTIKDGDILPTMCYGVYDSTRHYLEVAKTNNLTNFRKLNTGQELDFPPLEKE